MVLDALPPNQLTAGDDLDNRRTVGGARDVNPSRTSGSNSPHQMSERGDRSLAFKEILNCPWRLGACIYHSHGARATRRRPEMPRRHQEQSARWNTSRERRKEDKRKREGRRKRKKEMMILGATTDLYTCQGVSAAFQSSSPATSSILPIEHKCLFWQD